MFVAQVVTPAQKAWKKQQRDNARPKPAATEGPSRPTATASQTVHPNTKSRAELAEEKKEQQTRHSYEVKTLLESIKSAPRGGKVQAGRNMVDEGQLQGFTSAKRRREDTEQDLQPADIKRRKAADDATGDQSLVPSTSRGREVAVPPTPRTLKHTDACLPSAGPQVPDDSRTGSSKTSRSAIVAIVSSPGYEETATVPSTEHEDVWNVDVSQWLDIEDLHAESREPNSAVNASRITPNVASTTPSGSDPELAEDAQFAPLPDIEGAEDAASGHTYDEFLPAADLGRLRTSD